jgi:hypothetical protein
MAYVEILGSIAVARHVLTFWDRLLIGRFTRKNILRWMNEQRGVDWITILPVEDFHAVRNAVDIPWENPSNGELFSHAYRVVDDIQRVAPSIPRSVR